MQEFRQAHHKPLFHHLEDLRWTSDAIRLANGAGSEQEHVRAKAAQNPLLEPSSLRKLASEDLSAHVRAMSGYNPSLPEDLIAAKARGSDKERLVIAQHPKLTLGDAKLLADDPSPVVVARLVQHTRCPEIAAYILEDRSRIERAFAPAEADTPLRRSAREIMVADSLARLERVRNGQIE